MKKTILFIPLVAAGFAAVLFSCGLSGLRPGAADAAKNEATRGLSTETAAETALEPATPATAGSGAEATVSVRTTTATEAPVSGEASVSVEAMPAAQADSVVGAGPGVVAEPDDYLALTCNQDTAMSLLMRMGELYGDNPPGVVGFSADSGKCPEFIGGVYLNDRGVLVIQIRGDSATVRRRLEEDLQSEAFIVEPNLRFTQKDLLRINQELVKRWEALKDDPVMRNVKSTGVTAHAIEVSLVLNSPEKQREFREKVMDSPAFRFTGPAQPGADGRVGPGDTLGVYLRPEYEVYDARTAQVKFILYNRSGGEISFGAHYAVTYRDGQGIWRLLPINDNAFDIAYGLDNNAQWEFTASLYPDVHPNPPGEYRFFYRVDIGSVRDVLMMATFRLTDDEARWRNAAKTPVPEKVLGGLSEAAYREREERILEKKVFDVVEEMPEFAEGGIPGCLAFIAAHLPKDNEREGRVVMQFVVERDGTLSDIRVLRAADKRLADEAVRIIRAMPPWIPGRQKGRTVRVKYTLPVTFAKTAGSG